MTQPASSGYPVRTYAAAGDTFVYESISRDGFSARIEIILACAVVFFVPMNFLRLPLFYFTLSDGFAVLCILTMIFNRSVPMRPLGPGTAYWIFGLALLNGGLLMSSLLADVGLRALILCGQYIFTYLILPAIILGRPWDQTKLLMRVFVFSIVVMALHGVYVIDVVGERNTMFVSGSGRLSGFVERENAFGNIIALTMPTVLAMMSTRIIWPLAGIIILPLLTYAIMLTGSATALLSSLCGVVVFVLFRLNLARLAMLGGTLALAWSALHVPGVKDYLPEVFQQRVLLGVESGNVDEMGTFVDRMNLIREALIITDRINLFGIGVDRYREVSEWSAPVHNLYLLLWAEGGLPAMAGFLVMLVGALIVAVKSFTFRDHAVFAVCGVTITLLFAGVVNATTHVYGRFWAAPLIISVAASVCLMNFGHPARVKGR